MERAVMVDPGDDGDGDAPFAASGPRGVDDDFFCLRYRVWYASHDCAVRTRFQTSGGCLQCDQGRFNLKRHAASLVRIRWPLAAAD
jgi:hypothetical protein